MRSTIILSAILSSVSIVFAQTSLSTVQGTCVTVLGSKSVASVGTTTKVLTIKSEIHITTTTTPSVTIYPSTEVTTTSSMTAMTTYSTSEPVETDYYSSTSTNYQTTTVTVSTSTLITTTSSSTVMTTQTVTIPTSAGFIPVASGVGFPSPDKKRAPNNRFDLEARKEVVSLPTSAAQYAMTVTCDVLIEAFTTKSTIKTAKTTATVTAPPFTSTVFTTTTISTTTTIIPADVQITTIFVDEIAVTSTTTTISTSTSTATDIMTVAAPSATYYAACAANNLVSSAGGSTFSGQQVSGTVQPSYFSYQANAYNCCVQCMLTNSCAGSSYVDGECTVWPIGGTSGTSSGTCNNNVYFADFFPFFIGDSVTVSNGNCGQFAYGEGACYNRNGGFC